MAISARPRAAGLDEFVRRNRDELLRYVAPLVAGVPEVDAEDALHEGLLRVWRERAVAADCEPVERSHVWRTVRCAAIDAVREVNGRHGGKRGWIRSADMAALAEVLDDPDEGSAGVVDRQLMAVGCAVRRRAAERDEFDDLLRREVLLVAIAALGPDEQHVWFGLAGGASAAELAAELGVNVKRVRNLLEEARRVVGPIIEHALSVDIDDAHRRRLWALLDGQLRGHERRREQRHFDSCETCQRIAALERDVAVAGARVLCPLPALLGLGGVGGAAAAAGGTAASGGSASGGLAGLPAAAAAKALATIAAVALAVAGAAALHARRHPPVARSSQSATPTRPTRPAPLARMRVPGPPRARPAFARRHKASARRASTSWTLPATPTRRPSRRPSTSSSTTRSQARRSQRTRTAGSTRRRPPTTRSRSTWGPDSRRRRRESPATP